TRNKVVLEDQAAKSDVLTIPSGEHELRIGVITIPTFYLDFEAMHRGDPDYTSTTRDVAQLLLSLQEQDVDGLIVDLRDNGGGALQEATQLVSLFIDRGPTVQVRDARGRVIVEPDQFPGQLFEGPLAVLVNRHSASASEIFAGAMQDYGRALIIGDETFGKGTVQTLIPLNHGQLKMTQAKFYRVSGGSNQHRGVVPDISLPFLIDKTEIGESAQSNALPWDQINAASFKAAADLTAYIEPLKRKRDQRIKQDPEFHYIGERLALLTLLRERKEISLNEAQRKQDQDDVDKARLAAENRLRAARGLEALDSIKALKEQEEALIAARMAGEDSNEKDPYLDESGRVLADLIRMISRKQLVVLDPAA
ncbi:MAG: tail-specific protease, partial [Gammaproteobacteria bacterium HGW-Gammaproteobacteria-14]